MRAISFGAIAALALLAACQDRNPGDNSAEANIVAPRPIENLALPPADLGDEDADLPVAPPLPTAAAKPGTIPAAFQGRWAVDRSKCGDGQEHGLTVMPTLLRFYESEGRVTAVTAKGPRAITVTSAFSGEGQSWQDSQTLSLSEDGRTLTIAAKDSATRRVKCS